HDEVWHHYEGDPLRLYDYDPQCDSLQSVKLGPVPENDAYKYVVPADHWQAGLPLGDYCLLGCCVAPGFNFRDFSFLQDPHLKERLIAHRPEVAQLI
ncbi:cupin domain-containing protein, partial [candidate division KSB1 bacterium]